MENQTMSAELSNVEEKDIEPTVERLTKREYFTALALQSILKNCSWIEFSQSSKERGIITENTIKVAHENSKIIADICVKYADALLARLGETAIE
ncbi:hypothetical protein [Allocoleopsis franciscana]|nr:hypothetical protein [Allocoleopsis franciscana]